MSDGELRADTIPENSRPIAYKPIPPEHKCLFPAIHTSNGSFYQRLIDFLCDKERGLVAYEMLGHSFNLSRWGYNKPDISLTCSCGLRIFLHRYDSEEVPAFTEQYVWWFPAYGAPVPCTRRGASVEFPQGYHAVLSLCIMRLFDSRFGRIFTDSDVTETLACEWLMQPVMRRFQSADKDVVISDFLTLIGMPSGHPERQRFAREFLLRKHASMGWHHFLNMAPPHLQRGDDGGAAAEQYRRMQLHTMLKYRLNMRALLLTLYASLATVHDVEECHVYPYAPQLEDLVIDTVSCNAEKKNPLNSATDRRRRKDLRVKVGKASSAHCPACPPIRADVPLPLRSRTDVVFSFTGDDLEEPRRWGELPLRLARFFRPAVRARR